MFLLFRLITRYPVLFLSALALAIPIAFVLSFVIEAAGGRPSVFR